MSFYVRATGANKYAGGTDRWLKIRSLKRKSYGYELEVNIRGNQMFVGIRGNGPTENLEFAEGWPGLRSITHARLIEGMMRY